SLSESPVRVARPPAALRLGHPAIQTSPRASEAIRGFRSYRTHGLVVVAGRLPRSLPALRAEQDTVPPGRPSDVVDIESRPCELGASRRERLGPQPLMHLHDVEDGRARIDTLDVVDDLAYGRLGAPEVQTRLRLQRVRPGRRQERHDPVPGREAVLP